jgi:hypothetical protein
VSANLRARIAAAMGQDSRSWRTDLDARSLAAWARELLPLVLKEFDEYEADVSAEVRLSDSLRAELLAMTAERDEARDWLRRMSAARVLTCAFCGEEYPPGTPTNNHEALTAHVRACAKHPLRADLAAEVEVANRLGDALAAMTAERDKESADLKACLMSEARLRAERDSVQKALASYRDLAPMLAPEPVKCDGSCNGTEFGDCSDPGHVSGVLKGAVR